MAGSDPGDSLAPLAWVCWSTAHLARQWSACWLDAASSVFALFYVGLTLLALPTLREQSNGPSLVVFLLCVVWAGDIAALYVGRMWGRHKLAPTLSPNKTWEGAIGSVAGSLLVTAGLFWLATFLAQWNFVKLSFADEVWWYWLVMAVVVNVAAQVGDLAESALKRSAGVKDSGSCCRATAGCWTASTRCCWPLRCYGTLRLFASSA